MPQFNRISNFPQVGKRFISLRDLRDHLRRVTAPLLLLFGSQALPYLGLRVPASAALLPNRLASTRHPTLQDGSPSVVVSWPSKLASENGSRSA